MNKATTPFTFNIDEDVNNIQLDSAKFLQGVQQAGSTSENPVPETAGADEKLTSETITESKCCRLCCPCLHLMLL